MASLLADTTLGELLFDAEDVIFVPEDAPVSQALKVLQDQGIISLPVVNKQHQYMGILNLLDVLNHVALRHVSVDQQGKATEYKVDSSSMETPVSQLLGLTKESQSIPVLDSVQRLSTAVKQMASSGSHRALVQGKGWWRFLAEYDLVRFLAKQKSKSDRDKSMLGPQLDMTVKDLFMTRSKKLKRCATRLDMEPGASQSAKMSPGEQDKDHVVFMSSDETALHGFRLMAKLNYSALPILAAQPSQQGSEEEYEPEKAGELIGTLSSTDMRHITRDTLHLLQLPVVDFLKACKLQRKPITCSPDSKLSDCIELMAKNGIHRVWVVEPKQDKEERSTFASLRRGLSAAAPEQLVGLVSLSDVLDTLAKECDKLQPHGQ